MDCWNVPQPSQALVMYSYLDVPSSTTSIVLSVQTILSSWGGTSLTDLTTIIIVAIFSLAVLVFLVRFIQSR